VKSVLARRKVMDSLKAERFLRLLLAVLVVWDVGIGLFTMVFPHQVHALIRFPAEPEPLFTRGVGLYWLFAAYIQFLGLLNPRKFVVAVQLEIMFRLSAAAIDVAEVALLLPRPIYFLHYTLLFFAFMDLLIGFTVARLMQRMGLRWMDLSGRTQAAADVRSEARGV
jgi:hypothetical protein